MPCSCGNTICPCGIPCYCSEESCKCLDCEIALPRNCKICNKPLITERPINEGMCSCFMGESIAFILKNRDNPKSRMGNLPMPVGYFVPGKLMVNVQIPIPVMSFPTFIPRQPFCLMPPEPAKEADDSKISFISDETVLKPVYPPTDSYFPSSAELNQFLAKSNVESGDNDSSGYSSSCEQNAEVFCQKLQPAPRFFSFVDNRQTLNIVHNIKSETEDHTNIQEVTSFYLPSVMMNNISYPVGMVDPIWRLPNPAVCLSGTPASTLKLFNPFYVAGPVHTTQTVATCESDFIPPAPAPTSVTENKYRNVQAESDISLQMDEQTLDSTKTEQSNMVINDGNVEFAFSSNNTTRNEGTALPYLEDSNGIAFPEQCEISANCLMPDQSQTICETSNSTAGKNYSLPDCPDICNPVNQISDDVYPESTCEAQQVVEWAEIPVLTNCIPQVLSGNSGTFQTSRLQMLCERCPSPSSERPRNVNPRYVPADDKENIPLYIDPCTTQKMEKLLKATQKLNVI